MHAITANEPTTTTTKKSCTTRTEYNQRLVSLLKQNEELKTKLQQVQRSGQRYQLKSTVQAILIQELMETIEQFTITKKNNNNKHNTEKKNTDTELLVVLTTNYTQRMAELSMDRETMKIEKQVQPTDVDKTNNNRTQSNSMSLSSSSSSVVKEEEEEESTRTPPLLTTTNSVVVDTNTVDIDIDTNESVSMIDVLRQQRDSYQTKCETLTKSVTRTTQTLKKKHTEREIRCSLSLRTMRQQLNTMEQERKRWILSQEKHQTVADARIQSLELENHYLLTQQQQLKQQQQEQETKNRRGIMDDQREEEEEESKNKYNCHRIQDCVMSMRNTAMASRDDRDRDRDRQRMVLVVPSLLSSSSSSLRCRKPNNNHNNNNNNTSIPSLPLLVSVNSSSGEDTDTDTDNDHDHDSDSDIHSESIASSSSSSSSVSSDLLFEV